MRSLVVLFGFALLLASAPAAHSQFYTGYTGYTPINNAGQTAREIPQTNGYVGKDLRDRQRVIAILQLRNEAMRVQAQDGGTLSPEHQAQLQAKLDAIHAKWK